MLKCIAGVVLAGAVLAALPATAASGPWQPRSDRDIVQVLPQRWLSSTTRRELAAAQAAWRAEPHAVERVQALAVLYLQQAQDSADPRWLGQALALLQPWHGQARVPASIRVLRARLAQHDHQFAQALQELQAVLKAEPRHEEALLLQASIHLVQGRPDAARSSCAALQTAQSLVLGLACMAQHDGLSGKGEAALQRLQQLRQLPQAGWTSDQQAWLALITADLAQRLRQSALAGQEWRRLQALAWQSAAVRAGLADWLLEQGEYRAVLRLAAAAPQDQALLLRVAQAQQALRLPQAAGSIRQLQDRFAAARLRGDSGHAREEARFALHVLHQPTLALLRAQENWQQQREPQDARLLVQAAFEAGQPAAADPVRQWQQATGLQDAALTSLLQRVEARS